jgi:hypothetical protein
MVGGKSLLPPVNQVLCESYIEFEYSVGSKLKFLARQLFLLKLGSKGYIFLITA